MDDMSNRSPSTDPQVHNMAAMPSSKAMYSTPNRPTTQAQAQAQVSPVYQTPNTLSPQAAARERARVTILLEINSALLQEVVNLQASGKAGPASNQTSATGSPSSPQDPQKSSNGSDSAKAAAPAGKPGQEYVDCMRRLQANLAYLATVADRAKKTSATAPQIPAIMTPPPHLPSVNQLYSSLNELFTSIPSTPQAGIGSPLTPQQQQQQQQQQLYRQRQSQMQLLQQPDFSYPGSAAG
ncbi:uncharacterized protein GIQ15_05349 [Arthroderma uncinatum]|uniref:uncharacterized protein n=1 Tax=Arthroderma uncinatum TaxID=74035 RepID=UPI00144ABBF1|nr:uncharacterized protein GIQ15_05349 [Arthroderma uncinatum]KAF3482590.1 hypothetical protein GIQ15_05349 [Arthroderma uncinatum]